MFTTPMSTWKHSHDVYWQGRVWNVMAYELPPCQMTLLFNPTGAIDWIQGPYARLYLRGRRVINAELRLIGKPAALSPAIPLLGQESAHECPAPHHLADRRSRPR